MFQFCHLICGNPLGHPPPQEPWGCPATCFRKWLVAAVPEEVSANSPNRMCKPRSPGAQLPRTGQERRLAEEPQDHMLQGTPCGAQPPPQYLMTQHQPCPWGSAPKGSTQVSQNFLHSRGQHLTNLQVRKRPQSTAAPSPPRGRVTQPRSQPQVPTGIRYPGWPPAPLEGAPSQL